MIPVLVASAALVVPAPVGDGPPVTFVDVAAATGTLDLSYGRGAAMVDLDRDGRLDLVCGNAGPNSFFRQEADGTFTYANQAWGIPVDPRESWGVLVADFDNDGDDDVYEPNGGFTGPEANALRRNDLAVSGVFTDVSAQSGDADFTAATFGAAALDYDRDGDLDIFVSNYSPNLTTCTLLRNDGNLVFTDVSAAAGITQAGYYTHCTAGDYDLDGWPDLAVGDLREGPNRLYHNEGDGTFTEVAGPAGVASPQDNFGLHFEDFDNDGLLDLWAPKYEINPNGMRRLAVFMNNGDGTFVDATTPPTPGIQQDMGHATADVDDDGYPDVFAGTGTPQALNDDHLYRITPDGQGGIVATDISAAAGILAGGPTRMHGMAFGDYDQDGDLDVYCNNGGPSWVPTSNQEAFFFQSQGTGNGWVGVDLEGVLSNRSAVGARAVADLPSGRRVWRYRFVGHGFANTHAPTLRFGLAAETAVDRIEVTWPSGVVQILEDPAVGTRHPVLETGMLVAGAAVPGAGLPLLFVGAAGDQVVLSARLVPAPGGSPGVWPLVVPARPLTIGPGGTTTIDLPIPAAGVPSGATLWLTARIHPPGDPAGGYVTPATPVAIP